MAPTVSIYFPTSHFPNIGPWHQQCPSIFTPSRFSTISPWHQQCPSNFTPSRFSNIGPWHQQCSSIFYTGSLSKYLNMAPKVSNNFQNFILLAKLFILQHSGTISSYSWHHLFLLLAPLFPTPGTTFHHVLKSTCGTISVCYFFTK